MTNVKMVRIDLTAEQTAEIDAADGNMVLQNQIVERIAAEHARMMQAEEIVDRILDTFDTRKVSADKIKIQFLTDVILNVHHLLHKRDLERAMQMLCPTAAMLSDEEVPDEVLDNLTAELNAVNSMRSKADCKGEA